MLAKIIRGDESSEGMPVQDEEYRKKFDLLCKAVLKELCDDEEFEDTREKLLLHIFEQVEWQL